jgi:hypothetical protein
MEQLECKGVRASQNQTNPVAGNGSQQVAKATERGLKGHNLSVQCCLGRHSCSY